MLAISESGPMATASNSHGAVGFESVPVDTMEPAAAELSACSLHLTALWKNDASHYPESTRSATVIKYPLWGKNGIHFGIMA